MRNKQIIIVAILVSAFLLTGCGIKTAATSAKANNLTNTAKAADKSKPAVGISMAPVTPPQLTDEQNTQLAAGEADHKPSTLTFTVVGGNFFYVPTQIKVRKGDTVKIVFQNSGGVHNFNIDEYNLKGKTIKTGETDTVQFVADKAGTFKYYCAIGQHRKMGQEGTLVIE